MELNNKGKQLYDLWEKNYHKELDNLRKKYNDAEFEEGWSIIDTWEYVKSIEDEIGVLIFGYADDAIWFIDNYIKDYGEDEVYIEINGIEYTGKQIKDLLLEYFNKLGK